MEEHIVSEYLDEIVPAGPALGALRESVEGAEAVQDRRGERQELEQAEASLPDMLPQTRQWVAQMRSLAANTFAGVQALSGEIGERWPG